MVTKILCKLECEIGRGLLLLLGSEEDEVEVLRWEDREEKFRGVDVEGIPFMVDRL